MSLRRLLVAVLVVGALTGAPGAFACGVGGYSYAGVSATSHAFGISASVTSLPSFNVVNGHVAGWVGVGGPGKGPGGSDEWLQVGFSGFAGLPGTSLYYEVARSGASPAYHEINADAPVGRPVRLAVLEIRSRPNWWRVWVNGAPASEPIELPGSHGRWAPIATAESWDGNSGGQCNGFLYRFHAISLAAAPGGGWMPLRGGYPITSSSTRLHLGAASFLAAEGDAAIRTLASFSP